MRRWPTHFDALTLCGDPFAPRCGASVAPSITRTDHSRAAKVGDSQWPRRVEHVNRLSQRRRHPHVFESELLLVAAIPMRETTPRVEEPTTKFRGHVEGDRARPRTPGLHEHHGPQEHLLVEHVDPPGVVLQHRRPKPCIPRQRCPVFGPRPGVNGVHDLVAEREEADRRVAGHVLFSPSSLGTGLQPPAENDASETCHRCQPSAVHVAPPWVSPSTRS